METHQTKRTIQDSASRVNFVKQKQASKNLMCVRRNSTRGAENEAA